MVEITPEIKKIIEENPLSFATVDGDGKPNVIGVAYVKVVSKNQVLITDNYMEQTKENLEKTITSAARFGIKIGKAINWSERQNISQTAAGKKSSKKCPKTKDCLQKARY